MVKQKKLKTQNNNQTKSRFAFSNEMILISIGIVILILLIAVIITLVVITVVYNNQMKNVYSKSKKYMSDVIPLIPDESKFVDGSISGTITYEQFLRKYSFTDDSEEIPLFIFRTGELPLSTMHPDIVQLYTYTIQENPDFIQVYFYKNDRRSFIETYYPQYLESYDSIIPGAYKADIFRLCVIHKFGGVYMDMTMKPLKPLKYILDRDTYQMVTVSDFSISSTKEVGNIRPQPMFNGFFASVPNNVFFIRLLDEIKMNIRNKYYGESSLDITGPVVFGKVFNEILERPVNTPFDEDEYILPNNIRTKCLELDLCIVKRNAFIKQKNSLELLVQVKLRFAKFYGLYNKKSNLNYQTLWLLKKIYK